MKRLLFIAATSFLVQVGNAQTDSIDYFGQTPPGDSAELFARDIISLPDRLESKIAFSPDGNECFFEVVEIKDNKASYKIYYTKRENNIWTKQVDAPFSISNNVGSPVFSVSGEKIYFAKYSSDVTTSDIWMVERTAGGWGEPQPLPAPINSASTEFNYTETADSVIYFDSNRPGGNGGYDIWRKRPSIPQAENLGTPVNSNLFDSDPCVSPDGSYLIFSSERYQSAGGNLLCISFNKGNHEWTAPVDMNSSGAKINNTIAHHGGPSLSPDGKYLFFYRHSILTVMDVYWVSTHVTVGLRKSVFAPKFNKPVPNMTIGSDSTLNYVIPSNTFSCEYGVETLQYSAALSNGSALPSWLAFDSQTRTLSGKPTQAGISNIKITTTNVDTVSASCVFRITVTSATSINENKVQYPTELKLNQNYPNPFNPTTTINYRLPEYSIVKLKIFDSLGRDVKSLIDSFQSAGEHSITWDATDNMSNPVDSGIYIYKIENNGMSFQKKMILVR